MKKFVWIALILTMFAVVASAEEVHFISMDQCKAALVSGNFIPYTPHFTDNKDREVVNGRPSLINGTTRQTLELTENACVREWTYKGWSYIVKAKGKKMRWDVENGVFVRMYADDECGNPADEIGFAPVAQAPMPVVQPLPQPQPPPQTVVFQQPTNNNDAILAELRAMRAEETEQNRKFMEAMLTAMQRQPQQRQRRWYTPTPGKVISTGAILYGIGVGGEALGWWDVFPFKKLPKTCCH